MRIWERVVSILRGAEPTAQGSSLDLVSVSPRHSDQYRQGDLLFVKRHYSTVRGAVTRGDAVIERGELTGHAHRLEGGVVYDTEHERPGRVFVEAWPGARVVHEEHAPLELPAGLYVVIRQREYRGEEEASHVRD